ncbi:ACP S-malonyltransferase [Ideonella sp.]|uniref:ACP S-malonyltransferase n=1 Tax=Ideonella sp. TaxID=1929293 RepID=UPI0035B2A13F
MLTFMFPGQGAQHRGMGAALFEQFPRLVEQANAILGYDLPALCQQSGPKLNDTAFTQPALFTVNALAEMSVRRTGVEPDYAIGHSLGEYNALLSAGVIDFETGLQLVKMRGELMARQNGKGTMIAVLDPDLAGLQAIADALSPDFCIANDNSPKQLVCAGSVAAVDEASRRITAGNVGKVVPLKVSGAFHTRFMADAAAEFRQFCARFSFKPGRLPVVSNLSAQPHDGRDWPDRLAEHLTRPVQWRQTLAYLRQQGPMLFQEVGPGTVLTTLAKANLTLH